MRLIACSILLSLSALSTLGASASPLIARITKDVTSDTQVELGSFDASRYRQIRIVVKISRADKMPCEEILHKSAIATRLSTANRDYERVKRLVQSGISTNSDLADAQNRLEQAQADAKAAREYPCSFVLVRGGEPDEMAELQKLGSPSSPLTQVFDSPPTRLSFFGAGEGKYTILIYGQ